MNITRLPDSYEIITENENKDATVSFNIFDNKLDVYLTAVNSRPQFVKLKWYCESKENIKILGDKWERTYADMEFLPPDSNRHMPWYFIAYDGNNTHCCGVLVRPSAFVSFIYDKSSITAQIDVRNGSHGVALNGRKLKTATFIEQEYINTSPFTALKSFCKEMCPDPIFPKEPVYGGNNWYYAYGASSKKDILNDALLQAELSTGNKVKPFMVIDDGWTPISCSGPWTPNEKFGDMKEVADGIKSLGVRPGIWFRPLHDEMLQKTRPELFIKHDYYSLDPTNPFVKEIIKNTVEKIKSWGYELIKHDFTSVDLFGSYGYLLNGSVTLDDNWELYDKSITNAEAVLNLYELIRESAGEMLIIGCNTFSHLCAGLVEINRIGDDTSGKEWARTRDYGINSLAFRIAQNDTFYKVDADCVGIMGNNIDWSLNKQWLKLLSLSGSPLFVSCPRGALSEEQFKDIKCAYQSASKQDTVLEPLDWLETRLPKKWLVSNKDIIEFDWQ